MECAETARPCAIVHTLNESPFWELHIAAVREAWAIPTNGVARRATWILARRLLDFPHAIDAPIVCLANFVVRQWRCCLSPNCQDDFQPSETGDASHEDIEAASDA